MTTCQKIKARTVPVYTKLNANSGYDIQIAFGADFNTIKEATDQMKTQTHSTFL